ncbi:MAG TPA: BON domain-containing protein, partial [Methylomirabilota bacterium]|nr:BON domain-containing protein [Methylomirabilota bacterium]
NRTRTILAALATAAALASAGCGTMTVNPIAQFVDDSSTTTAIKTRLATDAGIGSMTGIGVRTSDDVVWLTGTVSDEAERQRVEGIARRIAGDNRVVSELRVANATASASPSSQKPTAQK